MTFAKRVVLKERFRSLGRLTGSALLFRSAHWTSILYAFAWCFGLWTLLCHTAVIAKFGLRTLCFLAPIPLVAGVYCAVRSASGSAASETDILDSSETIGKPQAHFWGWLILACLIVSLRHRPSAYILFWALSVLFVAAWSLFGESHATIYPSKVNQYSKHAAKLLLIMAVLSGGLTFLAHRPDFDDAFFVGVISDSVAHPDTPVLQLDSLYGSHKFPLILPTYKVDSIELLTGMLARTFGGVGSTPSTLFWAHAVMPTVFAMLLPFAWAFFLQAITRLWLPATVIALLLLVLLGETQYSLGNFAYVRLFQGKAVLASLGIPLIYAFAWRFRKTGRGWDWLTLCASSVAALGLSSAGLYLVPVALGIAAVASWRPRTTWQTLWIILPALYPIACGLALRSSFGVVAGAFTVHRTIEGVVGNVFGPRGQYLIFLGLLTAPLFAESERLRKLLSYAALLYLLGPLNPFLFALFSKLITTESVWRILWSLPVVGFTAVSVLGMFAEARRRWRLPSSIHWYAIERLAYIVPVVAVVTITGALLPDSTLRKSNNVFFSSNPSKIPPAKWSVVVAASCEAPPFTSVLAPEQIATWIPILIHRPDLVSIRPNYDEQMRFRMTSIDADRRRDLRELVSGRQFPAEQVQKLLQVLPQYRVSVIVVPNSTSKQLASAIAEQGYSVVQHLDGYVLWKRRRPIARANL